MPIATIDADFDEVKIQEMLAKQIAASSPVTFETRHRRKDGTVFEVEITGLSVALKARHTSSTQHEISPAESVSSVNSRAIVMTLSERLKSGPPRSRIGIATSELSWIPFRAWSVIGTKI
jgi:hypothetical protein